MSSQKVAALYLRVSTTDQKLDSQRDDLRKFAQSKNYTLFKEYADTGFSGSRHSRPQLDLLMADARRHKFNVVLVWSFSRFSRTLKQLVLSLEEFQDLGISFISYSEAVDTSTPSGRVLFAVVASFAQFEREIISERVRAGLRAAKARGRRLGRPHYLDRDMISRLRKEGRSLSEIATAIGATKSGVSKSLKKMSLKITHGGDG